MLTKPAVNHLIRLRRTSRSLYPLEGCGSQRADASGSHTPL